MSDKPLTLKTPPGCWREVKPAIRGTLPPGARAFEFGPMFVISEMANMEAPDGSGDIIPQWLISVSRQGRLSSDKEVARALRAFGMEEAEEDNHERGVVRKFFLVCDPKRRVDCECKAGEAVVTEPSGYRWSKSVAG